MVYLYDGKAEQGKAKYFLGGDKKYFFMNMVIFAL